MKVRVHKILKSTKVEGPGTRYCIWFQGCSRHCKGCWAKATWAHDGGEEFDAEKILSDILATKGIEGITFLGGEPFEQPEALKFLARGAKEAGLSVLCFSGGKIEDIEDREILNYIDLLIDGEYREEEQDFSGLVIARVNNYVNVRSMPSEEGEIVGKLYDKSVGEFIEEQDGWYKIKSGNCTGFVKGEFCVVGEEAEQLAKEVGTTYAIVNTTTLKVRKEASTESAVLGLVPIGEELIVVEELDGWVKIAIEEGDGYVSRDYVNLRTDFVCAE